MPKTSAKRFPDKFRKQIWKPFLTRIKRIQSEKDFIKLLKEIASEEEVIMIEKRLIIKELLSNGRFSQRKIAFIADVNKSTVAFVKRGLKPHKKLKNPKTPEQPLWKEIRDDLFAKRSDGIFPKYQGPRWK